VDRQVVEMNSEVATHQRESNTFIPCYTQIV
jgi:hypothetical protein